MTTLSPLLVKVAGRAVRFGPFRIAAPVAALAERSVNARTQPYNGDREAASRSPALPVDRAAIHAATMHKVAEVSRALKSVVSLIETLVQTASGGSDLTLAHWLILVSLCRAYPLHGGLRAT
jgi:hypothetical protein